MTIAFTTFLSHRYKSPEVNLFFFQLFYDVAEVQFEVDEGTFSTNVTRLERMIRAADAFIGIYPFPGSQEEAKQPEELRKASRYFRLELDLAIRSRKPAIIYYDDRYGNLLRCPDNILSIPFNFREVMGAGQVPNAKLFREEFKAFREIVATSMNYGLKQRNNRKSIIGIVVPQHGTEDCYSAEEIQIIEDVLEGSGFDDRRIVRWPPVLSRDTFGLFHAADWIAVDLGEEMAKTGIPAYLHGQFVPMMRLRHITSESDLAKPSSLEKALFGGLEVGYNKDIIAWKDPADLTKGLQDRLFSLKADVRRISNLKEAETYFRSAALHKEAVFLSYSGKDRDLAANLSNELKKHFQTVFDYRDGKSIRPGQPWLGEIFEQLSASAIGIPLLSENYFASGNCIQEAQQMIANQNNGKMKVLPIKLYSAPLSLPPWLQSLQYLRFPDYSGSEDIVREIIQLAT